MQESVRHLIQAHLHPQNSVGNCASEALGKVGCASSEAIDCLEATLGDSYYRARFHAAWSLGELRSVKSLPKLDAAIRSEEVFDVRKEMLRAVELLRASTRPSAT